MRHPAGVHLLLASVSLTAARVQLWSTALLVDLLSSVQISHSMLWNQTVHGKAEPGSGTCTCHSTVTESTPGSVCALVRVHESEHGATILKKYAFIGSF